MWFVTDAKTMGSLECCGNVFAALTLTYALCAIWMTPTILATLFVDSNHHHLLGNSKHIFVLMLSSCACSTSGIVLLSQYSIIDFFATNLNVKIFSWTLCVVYSELWVFIKHSFRLQFWPPRMTAHSVTKKSIAL